MTEQTYLFGPLDTEETVWSCAKTIKSPNIYKARTWEAANAIGTYDVGKLYFILYVNSFQHQLNASQIGVIQHGP